MKWDYQIVYANTAERDAESVLRRWGAEGWELVTVIQGQHPWDLTFYFKRLVVKE